MVTTLVVGGGINGLLLAKALVQSGQSVSVLERGRVGREASWAGGGIVSPLFPWRYRQPITALSRWSQGFYPELGRELLRETDIDPEVSISGLYWLDLDDEEEALAWADANASTMQRMGIEEIARRVPALGGGFSRGLYMPDIANVRNPRLIRGLRKLLANTPGMTFLEDCEVSSIRHQGGRVLGVATASGDLQAEHVVLAAGAWSARLLASLGFALPVKPVKGQMLLYKCAEGFLPSIVLAKGRYAIPRRDGHILVGSTLEHAGFDKTPTEEALASLKASAAELLPALEGVEPVGHWAGLRPGSPEGIPFIGPVPGFEGLWLNCGHYRNGLVLAPASCRLLADLMLGREPIVDPAPYAPSGRLGAL